MEIAEMEVAQPSVQDFSEDFSSVLLSQFSNSDSEHHLHVCAAIGAMSQELIDQNLSLTPITYFGATCSSLDLLSSSIDPSAHLLDSLLTILSLVIDKFSPAVLQTKYDYLSELLIKILRVDSVGINGVVPGLKCVSRLLIVRQRVSWAEVEQLYGVLVGYIIDDRQKVRKQSHLCLREVLQHIQLVPALALPASETITKVFEKLLLLEGGSHTNVPEGSKAAQKILYVLDALKICLPYIASKSSTNILKHFKSLLELRHPLVTRCITDGLNSLCLHSRGEISAEILLDLLCFLAASVSQNESSADSMTFIARLLETGMKRVYSINTDLCVIKLPSVLNALKDVLASGHEEALVAAVATCKSLLSSCIDETLIKQCVDQVTVGANSAARKSGPTVIEKVCASIEGLLDYHHEAVWDISFQIVSTMFEKLGKYSFYFLKGTLTSLADMQKLPEREFAFKKQLHECIGTALGAMGPENFLSILPLNLEGLLPLNLEVPDLSESNLWLFPILKQYTVGAHLSFFTKSILPMVIVMKRKSAVV